MKAAAFDIFSGLIFLAVVMATGDLVLASWIAIAFAVAQLAWMALKRTAPSSIQWAVIGSVLIFGGATVLFDNPLWVKLKPSALEAMLGLAMLPPGWFYRYLPESGIHLFSRRLVVGTGLIYAIMCFAMAGVNLWLAFAASARVWAMFNAVAPAVGFGGLGLGVYVYFRHVARRQLRAAAV